MAIPLNGTLITEDTSVIAVRDTSKTLKPMGVSMARERMTENDVTRTAMREISRRYWAKGTRITHSEAVQRDLSRPDLIVILEYQSQNRQWVVHSVESKVDRRYLTGYDQRKVCDGVKQARTYKANYRWLAISQEVADDLYDYEWRKLRKDCKRTKHNVGLMVALKTKAYIWEQPGYFPGYFIPYYSNEEWYVDALAS